MSLEVEKSYEEIDGVFATTSSTLREESNESTSKSRNGYRKIRPTDYRTFLKIKAAQSGRKVFGELFDRVSQFLSFGISSYRSQTIAMVNS